MRTFAAIAVIASAWSAWLVGCGPPGGSGACDAALLPGDLVITEVFADFRAAGDAGKEWFEIYNASDAAVALGGTAITHSRPDGARPNLHTMASAELAAGAYLVLGNAPARPEELPPYVGYGYGADLGELFNSDGGMLVLSCGDAEIDRASYAGVKEGHARELGAAQLPDYLANDAPTAWCQANDAEFADGNFGTPGQPSDCRPIAVGQCSERGMLRDAIAPGPGDLVITELMASPQRVADSDGEWLEAYVASDVDLNGVSLDRAGDRAKPDVIASSECVRAVRGSYVVFARSAQPSANGGIAAELIAASFRFALVGGSPSAPGDAAILAGATVIDAVSWTRSTAGRALQLAPERTDPSANDSESNFCDAARPYGPPAAMSDLGTPGAANSPCAALPVPGMCEDADGRRRAIAKPAAGALVISEVLANPAPPPGDDGTDATREWFEVANTGASAFDLNELTIGRVGAGGARVQAARCLSVPAGSFAVLARSAEPTRNGMLPAVAATFGVGLVDVRGDIQIADGAAVLDAVRWTSVTSGVAIQVDPARLTPADNDVAAHLCLATEAYGDGSNRGSPGQANRPCR